MSITIINGLRVILQWTVHGYCVQRNPGSPILERCSLYRVINLCDNFCLSIMLLLSCAHVRVAVYQYDKLADRMW
jgi:hypothetical protein